MTPTVENLVLEQLRYIRGRVDQISDDMVDIKNRMSAVASAMQDVKRRFTLEEVDCRSEFEEREAKDPDAEASVPVEPFVSAVEHEALLDQWNAIVAASGSRTHGGAVAHVADMRRRLVALQQLADKLASEALLAGGGPDEEVQIGRFQVLDELASIVG